MEENETNVTTVRSVGLKYGLTSNESYPSYSHFGDVMFEPNFPATFACNAEVEFLLAEALETDAGCRITR